MPLDEADLQAIKQLIEDSKNPLHLFAVNLFYKIHSVVNHLHIQVYAETKKVFGVALGVIMMHSMGMQKTVQLRDMFDEASIPN